MRLSILIIAATTCISGCGTLFPERYITTSAPPSSGKSLADAVLYADSTATEFKKIQIEASETQVGVNLVTLAVAILAGSRVVYSHSISSLRGPAIALATLGGINTLISSASKRQALDEGIFALSCAKQVAYSMDALPDPLTGLKTSSSPSPMVQLFDLRSGQIAVPAAAPGGANSIAASRINEFAASLEQVVVPAAPGAKLISSPLTPLANTLKTAASEHATALADVTAKATAVKLSSALYLQSATERIALSVVSQMHQLDPATKDIVSAVRSQSTGYLSDFKSALETSQQKAQSAKADVSAVAKVLPSVIASAATAQVNANQQVIDEAPPTKQFQDALPEAPKSIRKRGQPNVPAPEAAATDATATAASKAAANSSLMKSDAAVAAVQSDIDLLKIMKAVTETISQCGHGS